VAAEILSTSGYYPIPDDLRGPVDGRLSTRHHGGDVTLERAIGSGAHSSGRRLSREP
jgi:hypothetical protein